MDRKSCLAFVVLLGYFTTANATLIDQGDYLTDTSTGLDWYDLSFTMNKSYSMVVHDLESGGLYEGWSIATHDDITSLYDAAGGTGPYQNSSGHESVFQLLQPTWGGIPEGIWANTLALENGSKQTGITLRSFGRSNFYTDNYSNPSSGNDYTGTALIRVTSYKQVPEPSAIALMLTGLIGLIFIYRRNSAVKAA